MNSFKDNKNILVLGPYFSPVSALLAQEGYSVVEWPDPADKFFLQQNAIYFAISYKYRHIIKPEIIELLEERVVNLHISYLPWNRGADPNLWSFLEDTPKGVSIHYVDTGIDTGDLIAQKKIFFDEEQETLSTTYNTLNNEIIRLLGSVWESIVQNKAPRSKQKGKGSYHKSSDKKPYEHLLGKKGWDTPVMNIKGKALHKNS